MCFLPFSEDLVVKPEYFGSCQYSCQKDGKCTLFEKVEYVHCKTEKCKYEIKAQCASHDFGGVCLGEPRKCQKCRQPCDEKAMNQDKEFTLIVGPDNSLEAVGM